MGSRIPKEDNLIGGFIEQELSNMSKKERKEKGNKNLSLFE